MDILSFQDEIVNDLVSELAIEEEDEISKRQLISKVKNAIQEVQRIRNYPKHYTDDMIVSDMKRHYSNIHDLALYDYNQIGVEGQLSHNSGGTSRTWKSRFECLQGVVTMCDVFR